MSLALTPEGGEWTRCACFLPVVVGGGLKASYDVLLLIVGRRLARERGLADFK